MRSAAAIFPFAHALDAVRDAMIDGGGAIGADFSWVVVYTVVAGARAILLFRRKMVE